MTLTFKTIIAAVDVDDDLAQLVLMTAHDLATANSADLHVLDANPLLVSFDTPYAGGAIAADVESHRINAERRAERLGDLVDKYAAGATKMTMDGDASRGATTYAREVDADLIVIGSHQKGWWSRLIEGSESEDFLRESPCAIFVVTKSWKEKLENL